MEKILTCKQMQDFDSYTIHEMGMPGMVLMERAALAAVDQILASIDLGASEKILVVCGSGNNGGDGFAIARLLHLRGLDVTTYFVGNPEHCSEENLLQQKICHSYLVPMINNPVFQEYTIIVDAIFGIGLKREITGELADIICAVNAAGKEVFSIDIPSGIDGTSGGVLGAAIKADKTITFGYLKIGLCLFPGASYAGKVICADVGIYETPDELHKFVHAIQESDLQWIPKRINGSHKGNYGKVLIVAGSEGMCGAAYLCASACFSVGCGMIRILTIEENRSILQIMLPEAMISVIDPKDKKKTKKVMEEAYSWCDVVGVGPGIGQAPWMEKLILELFKKNKKPTVIDADALNILSKQENKATYLHEKVIVTPHMGEMGRLNGKSIHDISAETIGNAEEFANQYGCTCVLKNARTIIASPDGSVYLNMNGNHGMSTAGSGDVLTGILTGLLALGMDTGKAAPIGVYLHGAAGDLARQQKGAASMKAGDLICEVGTIMKKITGEELF